MKWQPIETAPKDGTKILVFQSRKHWADQMVVYWENDSLYQDGGHWFVDSGKFEHPLRGDDLTHWMPLPEPPKEQPQ